jgi:hypothetical protein
MTDLRNNATGGCLCGAVRYQMTGQPLSVIYCHCQSCRKHAGAPVVALAGYRRDQMSYTSGAPKVFASSPGVGRAFCGACGTPLTWEGDGGDIGPMVEILVGTLDTPEDFAPECHIHDQERLPWFETHDSLPRYKIWHDDGAAPYRHGPDA